MSGYSKSLHGSRTNPKIIKAGAEAAWLWHCSILYCGEHLTDGLIETAILPTLYPVKNSKAAAKRLVELGLWHEVSGGWVINDYLNVQMSAHEVRSARAAAAKRQADARARKAAEEAEALASRNGGGHA